MGASQCAQPSKEKDSDAPANLPPTIFSTQSTHKLLAAFSQAWLVLTLVLNDVVLHVDLCCLLFVVCVFVLRFCSSRAAATSSSSAPPQSAMVHIKKGARKMSDEKFNESFMMHTSTSPQYTIIASLGAVQSSMSSFLFVDPSF